MMKCNVTAPKKNLKPGTLCSGEIKSFDRFIPNRANLNNRYSHFLLTQTENETKRNEGSSILYQKTNEPNSQAYRTLLNTAFNITESFIVPICIPSKNQIKRIPKALWPAFPRSRPYIGSPVMRLDLPNLDQHLYANIIDWSSSDYITAALNDAIHLRHRPTGTVKIIDFPRVGTTVKWSSDGRQLAIGTRDGYLSIWDLPKDKIIYETASTCFLKSCLITAIEWHPTEKYLVTGCTEGSIKVYSLKLLQRQSTLSVHTGEIITLVFNCDGRYLASSSMDGYFLVFPWKDSATQACLMKVSLRSPIRAMGWHPWKPFLLCVGSLSGNLNLWNVSRSTLLAESNPATKEGDHHHLYYLTFNKITGELVTSHSLQNRRDRANEWQTKINVLSSFDKVVDQIICHRKPVLYMKWSADGTQLATAGVDEMFVIRNFLPQQKQKHKRNGWIDEVLPNNNLFLVR